MFFHDIPESCVAFPGNVRGKLAGNHCNMAVAPENQVLYRLTDTAAFVRDHTRQIEARHAIVDQYHGYAPALQFRYQFRLSIAPQNHALNLLGLSGADVAKRRAQWA